MRMANILKTRRFFSSKPAGGERAKETGKPALGETRQERRKQRNEQRRMAEEWLEWQRALKWLR